MFSSTAATGVLPPRRLPTIAWGVLAGLCLAGFPGCGGVAARSQNAEGVRLFDQARYEEAIGQFQLAVNYNPNHPDGYYNLAAVHHRLGLANRDPAQLAQAEHYYNQCLDRDENHRQCYRALAVLLVEQERSEEAFRLIEGWADRSPTSPEPKIELARLYQEFGEKQAAKERLLEALAADPKNARALAALGKLREQAGEHALALNDYQQSLWQDRYQPEVAARVSALQSTVGPTPLTTAGAPPDAARIVSRNNSPLR